MAKTIKKTAKKIEKKAANSGINVQEINLVKYEISLVVNPEATDKERELILDNVRKVISLWGGQVTKTDEAGKKMLAYEIKKHNEAWYFFMDASLIPSRVADLNSKIALEDKVLRHLIVRAD